MRILAVVSHPIQYHAVIWREIAKKHDLLVCFLEARMGETKGYSEEFGIEIQWDRPVLGGYVHRYACESPYHPLKAMALLGKLTIAGGFDAVYVHGHNRVETLFALILAVLTGKRAVLRNIAYDLGERPWLRSLIRRFAYGLIHRLPVRALFIGQHNRNYYLSHGMAPSRLFFAPHVVDNAWLREEMAQLRPLRSEILETFGFEADSRVILFCGKLIDKKRPLTLIEAFKQARIGSEWRLLIVGEGGLREQAEAASREAGNGRIRFTGFLNQSQMPRAYAAADLLVLPSAFQETWGLVVNEALNFDCAAIVSDRVGCGPDLVEGKTGVVFPHDDIDALAHGLEGLCNDPKALEGYRAQAAEVVRRYEVDAFMQGLEQALK